jgi:hypothetical protein
MDTLWLLELERERYQERLRQAEENMRLWRSPKFRKLPKLVQNLILMLG